MAIAAVLSSASTTNIRRFLWLFYFLSLFMSQSCLADHDQFNFNLGCHFSRKLCPGSCSMKFELQPFFRDSPVSELMHLSASSNLERKGKKNRASKMYLSVSAAALVLIAVSTTWHMREETHYLMVKGLLKEKKLEPLVDCDLQGNYIGEEVEELIEVALLCTQNTAMEWPKMSKVVRMLEGDGLSERWEEWQKEEIFRPILTRENYPQSLTSSEGECAEFRSNGSKNMPLLELVI
ncbi:hypothetical protein LWI28_026706 [Acer negundo]|uniref:Uncharacterized protein n=1 Tax=Acer negundo TaxID=4023 RepID=A0AAD5JRM4_ACENE|nr:hypothetical protein LWI28_026706 [Acer negundo]